MDIVAQMSCLATVLEARTLRQMSRIATAMMAMTGRVTMLGIARWGGKGGSYRTVQRFFHQAIPWGQVLWLFFRALLWRAGETYLLAGDEVVVSKAGKKTHGLDRFFSAVYGKRIKGLAFLTLALVSVEQHRSYPIMMAQQVRAKAESQAGTAPPPKKATGKGPGRPTGSKDKDKSQIEWTPELRLLQQLLSQFLAVSERFLTLRYLLLDGQFAHNNALQVVRQSADLHLISKLRSDAALYLPAERSEPKAGRPPKYGPKLCLDRLPEQLLKERTVVEDIQTEIYQGPLWNKPFPQRLNIVLIVKTNLKTAARAHAILFSSDLELSYQRLIHYYRLRFQIEFNFRDAKQYWGLEDFMTIKATAVTNAATLSLFMVNLAHALLDQWRTSHPAASVLDLKASFRGRRYAAEALNLLPQPPDQILLAQILDHVARLGCVHPAQPITLAA